ncbi:MAG: hypothetical protein OSJ59_01705 [Lachnospiraceae bacterium]|nr:hypothetical protein [Lachnospiraceae bacterium]
MEQRRYRVISLDLWDTVIRRKCHPDEIKEKTTDYLLTNYYEYIVEKFRAVSVLTQKRVDCEREIGEESREKGLDDEYEIHKVFERWLSAIMPQYPDRMELVNKLYEYELYTEIKNAYLDPTIVAMVEETPHDQLIYISDFYAGTDFLNEILIQIDCPLQFDKQYVSCDCGYNKRKGHLFEYVANDMQISYEQQLHIGDNQYSDVEIPQSKGIRAIHYLPEKEHEIRVQKEKKYAEAKKYERMPYRFGKLISKGEISVFFYGFIQWILESCLQDDIEELYFFTREGEFYKQVYDEIIRSRYKDKKMPKAVVLEVSRLSTFCASLRDISLTEMMRIWNQYSIQSLAAMFKSLGISRELITPFTEKYHIPLEEIITYPWQDTRVIALFRDADFFKAVWEQRNIKRELLLEYLGRKGIDLNEKRRIGIVDIGWRGTIQDNISYLLPNCEVKGYYIGLIPFLNEQPVNTIKRGYVNGYEKFDLLLQYVMPFEMICNSPNGSTTGYERAGKEIYAIRKKEEEEDRIYYRYTESIQKNILKDIRQICNSVNERSYIASGIRGLAHKKLGEYILNPQRIVTEAYFSLRHNEEFGVGEYVDKTTEFRFDLFGKALLGRKYRSRLAQFLRDTTWPQGYLVKYHLAPLVKLYNLRYSGEQNREDMNGEEKN